MDDKRKIINNSIDELYNGFNQLFNQQLTEVFESAQKLSDIKIKQLEDENTRLREKFKEVCLQNEKIRLSQQSYIFEIDRLKNRGNLFDFINIGLFPKLYALHMKLQNIGEEECNNNPLYKTLENTYNSIIQTMSNFDMRFYSTEIGCYVDYSKHEVIETIPTNNKDEHEMIVQSIMPGIEFKSGDVIKEKVKIRVYQENRANLNLSVSERRNNVVIRYSFNRSSKYSPVSFNQHNYFVGKFPYSPWVYIECMNVQEDERCFYKEINVKEFLEKMKYSGQLNIITLTFQIESGSINYKIYVGDLLIINEKISF